MSDPRGEVWLCGAFQHLPEPYEPYRCTEPYGHAGAHRAVVDGEIVAQWAGAAPARKTTEGEETT